MAKETLYIDADEEITSLIDKVVNSPEKIVALVLPKRAAVLQSTVNMKLLNKAAKQAKKNIVLITSDDAIHAMAGIAGIHTARSLTSKPTIPKTVKPETEATISSTELETAVLPDDSKDQESLVPEDETIEIDNTSSETADVATDSVPTEKKKKFKVPNFNSFRLRLSLGVLGVVLLVIGWILATIILPKATVTLTTNTSRTDVVVDFKLSTAQLERDLENNILPAKKAEVIKENVETVPATGQKDIGEKATGTMTLTNCIRNEDDDITIPAGTSFSSGSFTFVTDTAVTLGPAVYVGNTCRSGDFPVGAQKDVAVTAANAGTSYNLGAGPYTSSVSGINAYGSAMTGGTSQIVKVVTAQDIETAKQRLAGASTAEAVTELKATLAGQSVEPMEATLTEGEPKITSSPAVDTQADEVKVTMSVAYQMLGVSGDDLNALFDEAVQEKLADQPDQNVRDNGKSSAVYRVTNKASVDDQSLQASTVAVIGPEFDEEALKKEIAGKKRGEIESLLSQKEGVRNVLVEFSPFWVFTAPDNTEKITIIFNEESE